MFYLVDVEDYIRVEPKLFGLATSEAVEKQLKETYKEYYDKEIGKAISIIKVTNIGKGVIIPGDGAAYYKSEFRILAWKPELQEITFGIISEITNFGAFINLGTIRGMIHIGQTMDDFVSFSKSNTLSGKSSKRVLKTGDHCIARIVAISHKGDQSKIGMTMRQPGLGKIEWIKEEKIKTEKQAKKTAKAEEKEVKTKKAVKKKNA